MIGYGDINIYTRYDQTQSIGFERSNPYKELRTKLLYFCCMVEERKLNLRSLLNFGIEILTEFSEKYEGNCNLFDAFINTNLSFEFFDKFEKASCKFESLMWDPSVRRKDIGRSSLLGFKQYV